MRNARLTRRCLLGGVLAVALADKARAEGAKRVVALDGLFAETLVAIGQVPIAIANRPLYEKLTAQPPLPPSVLDLGPLQEPNLEFLRILDPDLIVAAPWQAQTQAALARLAPVLALPTTAGAREPLDHLDAVTRTLAARVDRQAAAEALIAGTAGALAGVRAALAGGVRRSVYVCRLREDGRQIAVFGPKSTVGAVAVRLGLTNAWTGRQSGAGTALTAVEDLAADPDAILVHFDRGAETVRALRRLAQSPIWQALSPVRAGRVVVMPVVHPNGGLPSAARFAAQLATALPRVSA